ncbi:MAG: NAD(P)H-dependent glycerol-3-phosphate dehydrogenase [Bryobacteraceae bacterium]|nr:NAD(P)H-dependent glycerol-3-phosphate dehydrogenase [Bryobacteraceae bacterium]
MNQLAILGAGSWGTALAMVLAPRFSLVRLWVFEADLARRMAETGENDLYLPGFRLPSNVQPVPSQAEAVGGAEVVLSVLPSQHVRRVLTEVRPHLDARAVFVTATKGLESGTLMRMTEVIADVVPGARVAALSGPTFAREVAAGEPAAIVIAAQDAALASSIQAAFSGPTFRLYTNADPVGVELAAALKNVMAIAAGVCQGLRLGSNARAALIARGLAEMTRLAVAAGGSPTTLAGLAGLGDLVLTCTGELSRNRQVGIELGCGRSIGEIVGSMRMVAEGVKTTESALALASRYGVELPITRQVQAIFAGKPPREALRELMERSLKGE